MATSPDQRLAPRYDLIAQANVDSGGEAFLMPVRNISKKGAFLEASPDEHPELKVGVELDVVLSASTPGMGDDEVLNIKCKGRIERIEPPRPSRAGGFGITLHLATAEETACLEALIGILSHLPPPRPAEPGT
jgi:hypothetical protein